MSEEERRDLMIKTMLEAESELTARLTESERWRYFLGRMQFVHYKSGSENLKDADCSGMLCLCLLLSTGCSIRVTADALYRKYFTKTTPGKDDIKAVFFVSQYDRPGDNYGRVYHEDECAHVAGICGNDVVLDAEERR